MYSESKCRPRVGVPWRTVVEEKTGQRARYEDYLCAIQDAGGDPIEISLLLADNELWGVAESCDAFVLPGSPADVNPTRYGSVRHNLTADADLPRERADDRLLDHALTAGKPLLAICFGIQSLNVHLAGSLVQDIPSELPSSIDHDREEDHPDTHHSARIEGGQLAELAGRAEIRVNSSHHQAVLKPGRGLCITARAPDGVIEAMEWTGGPGWVVGVQWHPERMRGDALSEALFRRLVFEGRAIAAIR